MTLEQNLEPFQEAWKTNQNKNFLKIHMTASRRLGLQRSDSSFIQYMTVKQKATSTTIKKEEK